MALTTEEQRQAVHKLIKSSAEASTAEDSLRFAEAARNCAVAIDTMERDKLTR